MDRCKSIQNALIRGGANSRGKMSLVADGDWGKFSRNAALWFAHNIGQHTPGQETDVKRRLIAAEVCPHDGDLRTALETIAAEDGILVIDGLTPAKQEVEPTVVA